MTRAVPDNNSSRSADVNEQKEHQKLPLADYAFDADEIIDFEGMDPEIFAPKELNDFGTFQESFIEKGRNGVLPPDLSDGPLASDEFAFALDGGELRKIAGALNIVLRHQPAQHRRCRLLINSTGIIWHANQVNGFIEYLTSGQLLNFSGLDAKVVVVALPDLTAAAFATKNTATFRVQGDRIKFTAERFARPILTFPTRTFTAHTDKLLERLTFDEKRPKVPASIMRDILAFLKPVAASSDVQNNLSKIEIKNNTAMALRPSVAATVETKAFEGLNIVFRPHFLNMILPSLRLCNQVSIQHSDELCVIECNELKFGFELIKGSLPPLPIISFADTIMTARSELAPLLARSIKMFGIDAKITLSSGGRGMGSVQFLACDAKVNHVRRMTANFQGLRDGKHEGPLEVTFGAIYLLHAVEAFSSDANLVIELSVPNRIRVTHMVGDKDLSLTLGATIKI